MGLRNLKLSKQLNASITDILGETNDIGNKEKERQTKAIVKFLRNKCLEGSKSGNNSIHLKKLSNNTLLEKVLIGKNEYIVVSTEDIRRYARYCNIKFEDSKDICTLTW